VAGGAPEHHCDFEGFLGYEGREVVDAGAHGIGGRIHVERMEGGFIQSQKAYLINSAMTGRMVCAVLLV
jgi:hypothetical protein